LDGAQDPISAGIDDAEPITEAREGGALTRPPNQTQDLQAQVGESVDSTDASGIHTEICVTQFLDAGRREQPRELGIIYPEICEEEEMCGWAWPALRHTVHRWGRQIPFLSCFMEYANSTGSFHKAALAMQLLNMVQREFDKQYRELKKALKAENEENDMRVRLLCASLVNSICNTKPCTEERLPSSIGPSWKTARARLS
jgi:hypothetical protein